jgi:hypothetical protein
MRLGIKIFMTREHGTTQKGMKGLIRIVLLGSLCILQPAVAQDLILSCTGTQTLTFIHYSESGRPQNPQKERKQISYTLSIEDSRHESYPCKFTEKTIWCDKCATSPDPANCKPDPLNYTSVDRYTGQTTVHRFNRLRGENFNLSMMREIEGVCSKAERKKF